MGEQARRTSRLRELLVSTADVHHRARLAVLGGFLILGTTGCTIDSFNPVTRQGLQVSNLYNLELVISGLLLLLIVVILTYSIVRFRAHRGDSEPPQVHGNARLEVVWTAMPVLLLAVIFVLTAQTIVSVNASGPSDQQIRVVGHQWWWEFQYTEQGVVTANELHLPVGTAVRLDLESADVIHSFWLPQFGWMRDAVPGKTNQMPAFVEQPGEYVGACTQYCGTEHAWMRIRVIVEPRDQFNAWLQGQRQPAAESLTDLALHGQQVFLQNTCVSCHTIQGTVADGRVGPNLTHFASRGSIGAGVAENTPENVRRWIQNAQAVKAGVRMPPFTNLSADDLAALAAYMEELR